MPTTITNAELAELAQVGLKKAALMIPALNSLSTTFRTEMAFNDTVKVPIYSMGAGSSVWHPTTNNYSHTNGVIEFKPGVLNGRFKQGFSVEDYLSGKVDKKKAIEVATGKVVSDALAFILASVTVANFGVAGVTSLAADFGDDDVEALQTLADNAKWDAMERSLILQPAYYNRLVRSYGAVYLQGGNSGVSQTGILPSLTEFSPVKCAVPGNAENLVGFACTRSALGCVVSTIKPSSDTVKFEIAEDPSGFSLGVREHYDDDLGQYVINVELICTPGIVGTGELKRIVSA